VKQFLSLFLALTALPLTAFDLGNLGDIGKGIGVVTKAADNINKANQDLSLVQKYYLGRAFGVTIMESRKPLDNPAANSYINYLGQALVLAADQPATYNGYRFQILDSPEVNAFSGPGGFIFITKGLIKLTSNSKASTVARVAAFRAERQRGRPTACARRDHRRRTGGDLPGRQAGQARTGRSGPRLVSSLIEPFSTSTWATVLPLRASRTAASTASGVAKPSSTITSLRKPERPPGSEGGTMPLGGASALTRPPRRARQRCCEPRSRCVTARSRVIPHRRASRSRTRDRAPSASLRRGAKVRSS